jgi:hypothetical protein
MEDIATKPRTSPDTSRDVALAAMAQSPTISPMNQHNVRGVSLQVGAIVGVGARCDVVGRQDVTHG